MHKVFNVTELTPNNYNSLYALFKSVQNTPDIIHNLTVPKVNIPIKFKALLSLGLKFCLPTYPDINLIEKYFKEGIRKVGWNIYFRSTEEVREETNDMRRFYRKNKKMKRSIDKDILTHCEFETTIFPNINISSDFIKSVKQVSSRPKFIPKQLLSELKEFKLNNQIVIKEADKNAGICFMNLQNYESEIFKQLEDCNYYYLSTEAHYNLAVMNYKDKLRILQKSTFKEYNLDSLIPNNHRPAKFYILPKVHKKYDVFPVGRPISSTINTVNSSISKLVDSYLQPIMNFIPDIILDSTHLLILLNHVKLSPHRKYALVTIDITAMYTNLILNVCKKTLYFCLHAT